MNDSDVLLYIKTYNYSKAKITLSTFLKSVLQTLQSQQNKSFTSESNDNCISSLIFTLLSNKLKTPHKSQYINHEKLETYVSQYKDMLRFLSENVFKILKCNELTFDNHVQLDNFIQSGQDVVDILMNCHIDEKLKGLLDIHSRLKFIGVHDDSLPLQVINVFEDLMLKTNSFTLSELKDGIGIVVNMYGKQDFNWEYIKAPQVIDEQMETTVDKPDRYKVTDEIIISPMTFSKATQTEDLIINDGKILFADTVVSILGLGDVQFQTLNYNSVNSILNEFVRSRLSKIISSEKGNISEADIKCMYLKFNDLCQVQSTILDILKVSEPQAAISKIKSYNHVINQMFELYNVNDEEILLERIEQENKLVGVLNLNYTNCKVVQESINSILNLNNNSTLSKFVKDFRTLHEIFLQCDFGILFSLDNIGILLQKLQILNVEMSRVKNQLSNKTYAYNQLNSDIDPLLSLKDEMGVDLEYITSFLSSVYYKKPLNVDVKNFFNSCQKRIASFEETRKECAQLKSLSLQQKSDILNLEKEFLDYQTTKSNLSYCNQKILEQDNIIKELRHENELVSEKLSLVEKENEEFTNALIIAGEHNRDRNKYIEELERRLTL